MTEASDKTLAAKITKAVEAVDAAIVTKNELARAAGMLLHAAHERHPGRAAFESFLKLTNGVQYSRAMDLIAVATDRKTFEKLQADAAARQKKHRDKKKALPRPEPKALPKQPEPIFQPKPVRDVTDDGGDPEVSAAKRKAEYANDFVADLQNAHEEAKRVSARCLAEFTTACRLLPKMTGSDRQKARELVLNMTRTDRTRTEAA
jgi:hypothetical protein